MPQRQWSLQDAKNRFSAVVEAARNGVPQTVTKHGKPVAVVLSVEEYEKLTEGGAATPLLCRTPAGDAERTAAAQTCEAQAS